MLKVVTKLGTKLLPHVLEPQSSLSHIGAFVKVLFDFLDGEAEIFRNFMNCLINDVQLGDC